MIIPQTKDDSDEVVRMRLDALVPSLGNILETTATASLSVGVLHCGRTVFTHAAGMADADRRRNADTDTAYLLGSLTKAMVSAACGILVDEGKLDWDAPLARYVPFAPKDPTLAEMATLRDALSHRTGLPQCDLAWYGAGGETLLQSSDMMHVVNNVPTFEDGATFRRSLNYSNLNYGLAGRVIESVGEGGTWRDFLREKIFRPLAMDRSCTSREEMRDGNFAEGHTALGPGRVARLPVTEVSGDSILGASMAVWSTVPDLLRWAKAVMERLAYEQQQQQPQPQQKHQQGYSAFSQQNPLRQISTVTAMHTRLTDTASYDGYALGWASHALPSPQLGWMSINGPPTDPELVIGRSGAASDPPRLTLYHGGEVTGYLNTIYLFPEKQSAVVVLTNSRGAGDASDWAARMLVEALFAMRPRVNWARAVRERAETDHASLAAMRSQLESRRQKEGAAPRRPPDEDVVSTYRCDAIRMTIRVFRDDEGRGLVMELNGRRSQRHRLAHYHYDVFSFLPASKAEQQLRCLVDYVEWYQWLVGFRRNMSGMVTALEWRMQPGLGPMVFEKI